MKHKYKFSKYLLVLVLFSQTLFAFKRLPENFYINYELFQFIKLRNIEVEKTQISSGEIKLQYEEKKKQYGLNILLKTKKFLKFYGDKDMQSTGFVSKKGLLFNSFIVNDLRKPQKNIQVVYDRKKDQLKVDYKKKRTEKKYDGKLLDIPTLILQFHFEKTKPKYSFDFVVGKKINNIKYKKIKDESIRINGKNYLTELYEGEINLVKNSKHFIWLSKGPYRVPIKIRLKMKGGLMIDQNLKTTDLELKN
ncbi:DUF3108 domain-containing protein [Methylophilaceae bacterium]|nr:DUF3108 domain-containing protein [Methylophilaceae bacterium]